MHRDGNVREFFRDILPSSFCNPLARTFARRPALVMAIFNRRNKFREYSFFFFFAVAKWRPEIELDDVSYFIYVEEGGEKKKIKDRMKLL